MGRVRRRLPLLAALPLLLGGCAVLPFVGGDDGDGGDGGPAGAEAELRTAARDGDELVRRVLPEITGALPDTQWAGFASNLLSCGSGDLGGVRWTAGGDLQSADPSLERVTTVLEDAGLEVTQDGESLTAVSGAVELTFTRVPSQVGDDIGRLGVDSGCADPGDREETSALEAEVAGTDYVDELDLPRDPR